MQYMATNQSLKVRGLAIVSLMVTMLASASQGQLSASFYSSSCPQLPSIVRTAMTQAVATDPRMGASILRMFFHDCFVDGCDASVLLDDSSTIQSEKDALPNANSLRGFEVIDSIKTTVEASCAATVSCADILALAARDGVVLLGGPSWTVGLGRRDSTTANPTAANTDLPSPFSNLTTLISKFSAKGLSAKDMTALSGAHTIGQARCLLFRSRIYNEANINAAFAATRQATCPSAAGSGDNNLAPIDVQTSTRFDNKYFQNLLGQRGLFHSDQELFNGGSQDALTTLYSTLPLLFSADFAAAMIKMGNISPLTGSNGQIRLNCRVVNS